MNLSLKFNLFSIEFYILTLIFIIINFLLLDIYIKYSKNTNLLDIPNDRSSHKIATPKGGGIVFSFTSIIFIVFIFKTNYLLILIPLLIIGFIDDIKQVSRFTRFSIHFFTSSVIVFNSNLFKNLYFSNGYFELTLIFVFLVISSVAIINFFNFADGVDGLVASSSSIYFIFLGFLISPVFLILGFSLLVFLFFNWSPAKLFMGDVGSTFIGALVPIAALSKPGFDGFFTLLLMTSPILMDPFFCVLRRLLTKQNIFMAHKSHLYQRLHQGGWKHSDISLLFSSTTFLLCSTFTFLDISFGILSVIITFLIGIYLEVIHAAPFKYNSFKNSKLKR